MTRSHPLATRPPKPATHPPSLRRLGTLLIWAAAFAFIAVIATMPLRPEIGLFTALLPPSIAVPAGLLFWVIFGLAGGLRARQRPGGATLTFSMPFIVAGTVLGGPVAGAWMGLVSEFELREIRTVPKFGILVNHAVVILAAIGAGLVGGPAREALESVLPGDAPTAFFGAALVTALVFDAINLLLVIPILALRNDLSLGEVIRTPDAQFRATAVSEAILAWLMAAGYLSLGWWAPIVCVVLVLLVWKAHEGSEALKRDDKTGLLNDAGFRPRLADALAAARVGRRSAALLVLDLDDFWEVNERFGLEGGDEVLIVTARRLLMAVRATDSVGRLNRAGDEFAILLEGMPDADSAVARARIVRERIGEDIRLRTASPGVARVAASIGVLLIERGSTLTVDGAMAEASRREARAKDVAVGIVFESGVRGDGERERRSDRKRAIRQDGSSPAVKEVP